MDGADRQSGKPGFQWTIARKVGGLTAVLILFILALLTYSVVTLWDIQAELAEIAEFDVPLTELTNRVEIEQLEQQITVDHLLREARNSEPRDGGLSVEEARLRIERHAAALKQHLESAVALIDAAALSRVDPVFEKTRAALIDVEKDAGALHALLSELVAAIEVGTKPDEALVEAMLVLDVAVDKKMLALIGAIEQFTNRELDILQNHERIFFLVNAALGTAGVLLGVFLSVVVIVSIRTKLFRLNAIVAGVSQAIEEKRELPIDLENAPTSGEIGELTRSLGSMLNNLSSDLQQREALSRELRTMATVDALTGAFNRLKWEEDLAQEVERIRRGGGSLSVVALDIDFFKRINDTYGHAVGDQVIAEMVQVSQSAIRKLDALYRIGGEEFVVLSPQTDAQEAAVLGEKIRAKVDGWTFKDVGHVTLSIGCAQFDPAWEDGAALLKEADKALYRAKEEGRNRVCVAVALENG